MTRLIIPYKTKEQLNLIFLAEDYLDKAGVSFDTATDGKNRIWELDYSLKGARYRWPRV